jgi:hypothetical protein
MADRAIRGFRERSRNIGKRDEVEKQTAMIHVDVNERPLRKILAEHQLESFITAVGWYAAAIDSCFVNIAPESRLFRILDHEVSGVKVELTRAWLLPSSAIVSLGACPLTK